MGKAKLQRSAVACIIHLHFKKRKLFGAEAVALGRQGKKLMHSDSAFWLGCGKHSDLLERLKRATLPSLPSLQDHLVPTEPTLKQPSTITGECAKQALGFWVCYVEKEPRGGYTEVGNVSSKV